MKIIIIRSLNSIGLIKNFFGCDCVQCNIYLFREGHYSALTVLLENTPQSDRQKQKVSVFQDQFSTKKQGQHVHPIDTTDADDNTPLHLGIDYMILITKQECRDVIL